VEVQPEEPEKPEAEPMVAARELAVSEKLAGVHHQNSPAEEEVGAEEQNYCSPAELPVVAPAENHAREAPVLVIADWQDYPSLTIIEGF
jgi:hypothetical protein